LLFLIGENKKVPKLSNTFIPISHNFSKMDKTHMTEKATEKKQS